MFHVFLLKPYKLSSEKFERPLLPPVIYIPETKTEEYEASSV
ncbi:13639_t:CDS:2 [Acaulospora morrowiae]|uniref:13639_t:CDS:1 n=1 Tax=Acaulospora morrowiae TaxID=94023 RepID=A0A9N8YZJ2_9GLOM|nr:13639_t:CDS:2 [Acaulospora morrowiae]